MPHIRQTEETPMIRIMFIIPYPSMEQDIASVMETFPDRDEIEYQCRLFTLYDLESYVLDWDCDVMIARGYSADVLAERNYPFPVVKLEFNSVDIINAVKICQERFQSRRIAVIGHPSLSLAAGMINQISDIPIEIYPLNRQPDIPAITEEALKNGNDTIIGGGTACLYAEQIQVNHYMAVSNQETLYQGISEAVNTVKFQRKEGEFLQLLRKLLDNSSNGYMIVNPAGEVTVCSKYAATLLGVRSNEVAGMRFSALIPEAEACFDRVLRTKKTSDDEMVVENGKTLMVSLKPILMDGRVSSIIVECKDINNIQELEGRIRKKLMAKGMVARYQFHNIIHRTEKMDDVIGMARKFAQADSNVLIEGETGTGKELFAQSIHAASGRKHNPFVAVNCAAIPEQLLESELFGYAAGSFTGALKEGKQGLFELAHNGTIFLDEISELPYSFQGKLLRVLQEREIRRIGADRIIPINVRVVAATNRPLEDLVDRGLFRSDLYFRLNVLVLRVPPLRERPDDIFPTFSFFLDSYSQRLQKETPEFSEAEKRRLCAYPWKGNVRELKNIAERFTVLYEKGDEADEILDQCLNVLKEPPRAEASERDLRERLAVKEALEQSGSREEAAERLGISRTTLWRKMRQYHLD